MNSNGYGNGYSGGIKRGDIFYADLSPVVGSEQGGLRPVLIIQNDVGNRYSPTVIAAAITSRMGKTRLPTHIDIYAEKAGLARDSVILLEQIRTLDKRRLKERMGHLDESIMNRVNAAIAVSFGLGGLPARHLPSIPPLTDTRVLTLPVLSLYNMYVRRLPYVTEKYLSRREGRQWNIPDLKR